MVSVRTCQMVLLSAALAVTPAFASRSHRAATAGHSHSLHKKHHAAVHIVRGQREIAPERAREIQEALIHQNYMNGTPSGQWDTETESAMQKYQADHGWQTKLTPDSRALIRLGLGPDHQTGGLQTAADNNSGPAPASPAVALPSSNFSNTLADAHSIQN
ncbi:peptidoglycan-binding domain-containing protein [Paracidobacterium acidisoli]|uniref:Peptidoglycan-binding protein n=1 Tax=Paracidobacterium acidisoli TaxID=2303751 RepID=A0A372IT13_9BACT|nr:peptidoglycan-binding domain-containing protein [Paracidobacterium acidisoli]MBT9330267.1 peptidoglycan-binding protein [Paracidobacterium acidisoli]